MQSQLSHHAFIVDGKLKKTLTLDNTEYTVIDRVYPEAGIEAVQLRGDKILPADHPVNKAKERIANLHVRIAAEKVKVLGPTREIPEDDDIEIYLNANLVDNLCSIAARKERELATMVANMEYSRVDIVVGTDVLLHDAVVKCIRVAIPYKVVPETTLPPVAGALLPVAGPTANNPAEKRYIR